MAETLDHDRYLETKKVTIVGAVINLFLAVSKLFIGFVGQSQALIADGIHSFSDLVTDAIVLLASKHASHAADETHPYGHARIETIATVVLGAFLIAVGLGIGFDAVMRMLNPERLMHPGGIALAAAIVSVLLNEGLYHYTVHVANKINSNMLRANAWHHRSDAISSVIVVIAVIASFMGWEYIDAIAAIIVAGMVCQMGWGLVWDSTQELIDTALLPEQVEALRQTILKVEGVQEMHMLRTRRMGADGYADVHVIVGPRLSVSEGHQVGEWVRHAILENNDFVKDVTVHIDPEDDENDPINELLPQRSRVIGDVKKALDDLDVEDSLVEINLHYLSGRVHLDLVLNILNDEKISTLSEFSDRITESLKSVPYVGKVRMYFK